MIKRTSKMTILILMAIFVQNCSSIIHSNELVFENIYNGTLIKKATEAYRAGNYEEATQLYEELLERDPEDAIVIYNLACCYALQDDAKHAAIYLVEAFENGFRDVTLFLEDHDFDSVRDEPVFMKAQSDVLMRYKSGNTREYVAALSAPLVEV